MKRPKTAPFGRTSAISFLITLNFTITIQSEHVKTVRRNPVRIEKEKRFILKKISEVERFYSFGLTQELSPVAGFLK